MDSRPAIYFGSLWKYETIYPDTAILRGEEDGDIRDLKTPDQVEDKEVMMVEPRPDEEEKIEMAEDTPKNLAKDFNGITESPGKDTEMVTTTLKPNKNTPSILRKPRLATITETPTPVSNNKDSPHKQMAPKKDKTGQIANPYIKSMYSLKKIPLIYSKGPKIVGKKKKGPDKQTLLILRLPVQVEMVKEWNEKLPEAIAMIR